MVSVYQGYESLRLVVSEALGGGSAAKTPSKEVQPIQTFSELAAAFRNIGGTVGG